MYMKKTYVLMLLVCLISFSARTTHAQCTANFSYSSSGNTVTFTDSSTTNSGSILLWTWNFGDGNFSTAKNPTHAYATCGVYNVSLTIFTSFFCSRTDTATVTLNGGINPSFTYNANTTTGNVNFLAQPFGFNLNYIWDFGDGTFDSTFITNHTYPTGIYNVCLTVSDQAGICNNTFCDTLTLNVSCATSFTYNDNGSGNVNFQVDPFSLGMTYNWDFGDGSTGTGGLTFHTFPSAGSYTVCLTAVDSASMCTSNFCDTLVLPDCRVSFNHINNNEQVNFIANSISFNNSYSWDFGDGKFGTGAFTSNTYDTTGVYYVCLTTTNTSDSCTATVCDSVDVVITGIDEVKENLFNLDVYPNPANDWTTISYLLNKNADIQLSVTDLLGNVVTINEVKHQPKGNYSVKWQPEKISAGLYLLQLKVNDQTEVRKLVISR
jgi:PKD repeat protein